jgi:hypothetical protein
MCSQCYKEALGVAEVAIIILAKLIRLTQQIVQRLAGSVLASHEACSLDADQSGMATTLRTFAFNDRPWQRPG